MSDKEDLEFALGQFDRLESLHVRVEGKGSFAFGLNVAMAGVTAARLTPKIVESPLVIPAVLTLLALGASTVFIYTVYFTYLSRTTTPSLVYFGDVARAGSDGYVAGVVGADTKMLAADALRQVWRNSQILTMKFQRIKMAYLFTAIAVPMWLLFLGLVSLKLHTLAPAGS